jgi:hypothetical protein
MRPSAESPILSNRNSSGLLPRGCRWTANEDGATRADVVRNAVALTGRRDLRFTLQEPFGFKDWNDQLRKRPQSLSSCRPEVPFVA